MHALCQCRFQGIDVFFGVRKTAELSGILIFQQKATTRGAVHGC
jgi:hypothetical protein